MISPLRKYALFVLLLFCGIVAGPLVHAIAHEHEAVECEFAKCLKTDAAPAKASAADKHSRFVEFFVPAKEAPWLRAEQNTFLTRGPPVFPVLSAI